MSPGQRHNPRRRNNEDFTEKQYDERVVHIDRVARVVKGGRRFRFRALVVVGDGKGKVGIGVAKGSDVTAAVAKASDVAKKHFITVKIYNDTIPHETDARVGGSHLIIKPASPGTGLIAGGVVRTVLEVAGVKNVLSKSFGSNSRINTAYATIKALQALVSAKDWLPRQKQPDTDSKPLKPKTKMTKAAA